MKKFMLILICAVVAVGARAQLVKNLEYPKMHYGVRLGATYNTFVDDADCKPFIFATAGVSADYRPLRNLPLYVESGLYYINKGRDMKAKTDDTASGGTGDTPPWWPGNEPEEEQEPDFWGKGHTYDNHGAVLPLLVSYHLYFNDNVAIQPFVGPYVGYFFQADQIDYGLRGGIGLNVGRMYVNAGCDYGMKIEHRQAMTLFVTLGFNLKGNY